MKRISIIVCVLCALAIVRAQNAGPRFEVASVKLNNSGDARQFISRRPGGATVSNMPVRDLIIYAYRVATFQLIGGPAWIASSHFDIVEKLETNSDGQAADPLPVRGIGDPCW